MNNLFIFVNSKPEIVKYYSDLFNNFIILNTDKHDFYHYIRDDKLIGLFNIKMPNNHINNFIINNFILGQLNNSLYNYIIIVYDDIDIKNDILRYTLKYSLKDYVFDEEKFCNEGKTSGFHIITKNDIFVIKNKII